MICAKTNLPWYIPHCLRLSLPLLAVRRRKKRQVENARDASHPSPPLSVSGNPLSRNRTALIMAVVLNGVTVLTYNAPGTLDVLTKGQIGMKVSTGFTNIRAVYVALMRNRLSK